MNYSKDNLHFSFPSIPDSIASEYGVHRLVLRSFGESGMDINIDFQQPLRPYLVTQILQACTENETGNGKTIGVNPAFFWDLTISKRIEALLAIATLGRASGLTLQLYCSHQTCGESIEVEITQDEIVGEKLPENNTGKFKIPVNGTDYFFRRPAGSDQLRWLNASFTDKNDAEESIIRDLWIVDNGEEKENGIKTEFPLNNEWVKAVDEGMEAMDRLVHFNLTVCCPVCNKGINYTIDLEALLVRRLHKIQLVLLDTIHRIAAHYHWSEQQILSVSPGRRAYYISLIERDDKNILK